MPQDLKCDESVAFLDTNACTKRCCIEHDRCFQMYQCNSSIMRMALRGSTPVNACNRAAAKCFVQAWLDCPDPKKCKLAMAGSSRSTLASALVALIVGFLCNLPYVVQLSRPALQSSGGMVSLVAGRADSWCVLSQSRPARREFVRGPLSRSPSVVPTAFGSSKLESGTHGPDVRSGGGRGRPCIGTWCCVGRQREIPSSRERQQFGLKRSARTTTTSDPQEQRRTVCADRARMHLQDAGDQDTSWRVDGVTLG